MAFGCVRAIINRKSAIIFDAHKPTIKVRRSLTKISVESVDIRLIRIHAYTATSKTNM